MADEGKITIKDANIIPNPVLVGKTFILSVDVNEKIEVIGDDDIILAADDGVILETETDIPYILGDDTALILVNDGVLFKCE